MNYSSSVIKILAKRAFSHADRCWYHPLPLWGLCCYYLWLSSLSSVPGTSLTWRNWWLSWWKVVIVWKIWSCDVFFSRKIIFEVLSFLNKHLKIEVKVRLSGLPAGSLWLRFFWLKLFFFELHGLWLFNIFWVDSFNCVFNFVPPVRTSCRLLRASLLVDAFHDFYFFTLNWQQKLRFINKFFRLNGRFEELIIFVNFLTMKRFVGSTI